MYTLAFSAVHNYPSHKHDIVIDSELTQTKVRGASQAMLYATGMTEEDMDKPQVGICSVWYEGSTYTVRGTLFHHLV